MLFCPHTGRVHPFPVDEKDEKISSKLSFRLRYGFFFPALIPEHPQKTAPANAGPGDFDGPRCFRLAAKWGTWLRVGLFLGNLTGVIRSPVHVAIETHSVLYKGNF